MKKLKLFRTLLVAVMMLGGVSFAWADSETTTTFDFEGDTPTNPFVVDNTTYLTNTIVTGTGDNTSKVAQFNCANRSSVAFASYDFSSLVEDASVVTIEFDFLVTNDSHHQLISIADADYHTRIKGGFKGNTNTGYGSNGVIFNLGCYRADGKNKFAINSTQNDLAGLGAWCHAKVVVDNCNKNVDYVITNASAVELASATDVAFLNSDAQLATQIDVYIAYTYSQPGVFIDNLSIKSNVVSTNHKYAINAVSGGTTLATMAQGMCAEDGTFSAYIPKVVNYDGKYYILDDDDNADLDGFLASYTMSTANVTKEINYTLDEDIVYFNEANKAATGSDVHYNDKNCSSGTYVGYYSSKTASITIAEAGKYLMETNVRARISSNPLNVYNSSNVQIGTIAKNSSPATGVRQTESFDLTAESTIKVGLSGGNSLSFDYIMIRKAPVAYTVQYKCGGTTVKTADATRTAVWGTYATLTDADKEDVIGADGHLYRYVSDDASSQVITSDGTTVITATFEDLGETIVYNLNVGTSAENTIASTTETSDDTNISDISIDETNSGGNAKGASDRTIKLAIKTGANGETFESPTNYVLFKYSVAAGKKFTPTLIKINVANVGSSSANDIKYKATLSDDDHLISGTFIAEKQDGTVELFTIDNDDDISFTGDVTLKLWAWQIGTTNASAFRMGTPLIIAGEVEDMTDVELAIADCKTYETSSAFATYIDDLYDDDDLSTVEDVYSALTQWEVDNASGNDITKVIHDAAVSDMGYWNSARTRSGEKYTGAPDNTYFDAWDSEASDARQTIYGLPAGNYTLTAATRASATLTDVDKYNVWLDDGSTHKALGNHNGNTGGSLGNGWGWTVITFTLAAKRNVSLGFYSLPGEGSGLWSSCDDFHLYKGNLTATATIGTTSYATFSSPYAVDFSTEDGLTVYKANVNGAKTSVVLTAIGSKRIPANTGVILAGSEATYTGTVVGSADAVDDNDLFASTDNTASSGDYILVNEEGTAVFAPMTSGTLATGKAYLPAEKCPAVSGGAKSLKIVFDDETLGINDASLRNGNAEGMKDNAIYNLSGQRIAAPQKGINIVNGKKIIVK